jgi:protein TonB
MAKPAAVAERPAPAEAVKTAPTEPTPVASGTAASGVQPAAPGEARSAPPAPAGATTEATAKAGSEADAGTREQYRLALIMATRRYKRYPAVAMEKGWQGRVEVHMVIGANGMIASASIKTSSGHEILDNQAMDMLKKGKTTVQIPASLRGREFSVDVPVIFNLDNPSS